MRVMLTVHAWRHLWTLRVTGDETMTEFHHELDACGLNCPLPVLRAKKTLDKMTSGEVLQIVATDPGSVEDMAALARQTGNELLESRQESDKYYFLMKKG